jgi:putative tryptophan/tyrosine transport system substrate-binding protein
MRRREFIAGLGSAVAWPLRARAQHRVMPALGYLSANSRDRPDTRMHLAAFHKGLDENGYVEGQNLAIDYRWAENQPDRLPGFAADLARRQVDVIAAVDGSAAALAAKAATAIIPVVFQIGFDPVQIGLVASLNRPGGNVTGMTNINPEITPKRLQLLGELVPPPTATAWLFGQPLSAQDVEMREREAQAAARRLRRKVLFVNATNEAEVDRAFVVLVQEGVGALMVDANPFLNSRTEQIVTIAARNRIATSFEFADSVAAGGLMSYGSSALDNFRQVGVYVGKILKGAKPADLPVLQPTKFELVINLKTAKALGLTVPEALLATADEVIK